MRGFNWRKSWHFGNDYRRYLRIEFAGFRCNPGIAIDANGSEDETTFSIRMGLALYITLAGFIPRSWYARDKNVFSSSGYVTGDREVEISWHNWGVHWSIWMPPHEWNSTDSKLRRGHIYFDRILFGKHKCEFKDLETEQHTIYFVEGPYNVRVTKKQRVDSWPRRLTRKSIAYQVEAGYYNNDGKWIQRPVPVEGKGENSWDCDENAIYSSHFPARDMKNCHDAALYFEADMRKDRVKYGGKNWMPRSYRPSTLEKTP